MRKTLLDRHRHGRLLPLWLMLPTILTIAVGAVAAEPPPVSRVNADEKPLVTRPDECVLLLGDHTVARTSHLKQRFFPAVKYPENPVMRRAQAWEGVGPYLFGSRLM